MSEIQEHEWAAYTKFVRERLQQRREDSDRSVPEHPEAESSLGYSGEYEPADMNNDPVLQMLVRFASDQGNAAMEYAAQYDNTDALGLHFSRKINHTLECVLDRLRERELHFMQFDDGEQWGWHKRIDGTQDGQDYVMEAVRGAILGVVCSHVFREYGNQSIYVIKPGSVPKWQDYVGQAVWRSCVLRKCDMNGVGNPDRFVLITVFVAREQWLFDMPLCGVCLKYMRDMGFNEEDA